MVNDECRLKNEVETLKEEVEGLTSDLSKETMQRSEENQLLTRRLAEKSHAAETQAVQLDDLRNEMNILKRRHTTSMKVKIYG